jgi:rubrerythrin
MVDGSSEMDLDLDQLMAMPDQNQSGFEDDETMATAVWAHRNVPDYVPDDYSQVNFQFDVASASSEVDDHGTFHQYDAGLDLDPASAHPSFGLSASGPSALQGQPPSQPDLASGQLSVTTTTPTPHPRFLCLQPDCGKQFNRAADLARHLKNVHCKDMNKAMHCDYRKCPRHLNAFHRFDHFRDHLRDQHREDLLKRGAGGEVDAAWWKTRLPAAVYDGWWRCSKCFLRVSVEEHEWRCPDCGNYCEQERQAMRKLPLKCDYVGCGAGRVDGEVFKSPARFREHLRTVHAEDVPRDKNKAGIAELQSAQWWATRYVFSASWRCTRCLDWVDHGRFGWECGRCGFECEDRRKVQRTGACGA